MFKTHYFLLMKFLRGLESPAPFHKGSKWRSCARGATTRRGPLVRNPPAAFGGTPLSQGGRLLWYAPVLTAPL